MSDLFYSFVDIKLEDVYESLKNVPAIISHKLNDDTTFSSELCFLIKEDSKAFIFISNEVNSCGPTLAARYYSAPEFKTGKLTLASRFYEDEVFRCVSPDTIKLVKSNHQFKNGVTIQFLNHKFYD